MSTKRKSEKMQKDLLHNTALKKKFNKMRKCDNGTMMYEIKKNQEDFTIISHGRTK